MSDSSFASYIHLVHRLIEKCLTFRMTKEECMEALSKYGDVDPVITSTVWNELEKENKEFFDAYEKCQSNEDKTLYRDETYRILQNIISDSSKD